MNPIGVGMTLETRFSFISVRNRIFYNEGEGRRIGVMAAGKAFYENVVVYLAVFLLAFLVFDSWTVILGSSVALGALYHFSGKWTERSRF